MSTIVKNKFLEKQRIVTKGNKLIEFPVIFCFFNHRRSSVFGKKFFDHQELEKVRIIGSSLCQRWQGVQPGKTIEANLPYPAVSWNQGRVNSGKESPCIRGTLKARTLQQLVNCKQRLCFNNEGLDSIKHSRESK